MAGLRGSHVPMPDEATLRQWYMVEKIPYRVMVERWEAMAGVTVTKAGMAAKCSRYDWYKPRNLRHAGSSLVPWTNIRTEHTDLHDIHMLRMENARRLGKKFKPDVEKDIDAYLRGLNEDECVVVYRRNTKKGFHHVPRMPGEEYVRTPEADEAVLKASRRRAEKKVS